MDYLFVSFPFRKVYLESLDFNYAQWGLSGGSELAREEGRLTEYSFLDGRYWDLRILSVEREAWLSRRPKRSLDPARRAKRGRTEAAETRPHGGERADIGERARR